MTQFSIYNMNTGEELGLFEGADENDALDVMAQAYGYIDYADCVDACGISVEEGKAELQISAA